ncbi:MAG: methyltransferase domain-containing protein [Actinomycetota bacterium]|nr:methyltransferase domain-containing protein [Actinomycetota bacterium]
MNRRALPDAALRADARRLYGADPAGYEAGRPDYPERVYELLATRCGVRGGARVLEIGPGTGRVTRWLTALGAEVVAVEPDPALAARLQGQRGVSRAEVVCGSFEDVALPKSHFDVVVAAMSFHWVNQDVGLPKLRRVVRSGGWVALWWTVFGDPSRPDPFDEATRHLTDALVSDTAAEKRAPFELDVASWSQDLEQRAGLVDVAAERVAWTARFDTERLRAFYGSMIAVRRLAAPERERLLDGLAEVAARTFGGTVERPFVTAVYTGRRS